MADKEERILIKKEINYHPPYGGWRGDGKEIVLTRTEAIERIEKVLEESWWSVKTFRQISEAALNALLEKGE